MSFDLPILAYHKVDSRRELGITSLSPERFEKQVRFLKREGYSNLSPRSLITRFTKAPWSQEDVEKADAPSQYRSFVITFDDGYEGVYTYAFPILKKYALNAIIFVSTGYIGKYNSWDASPGPRFKHLDWAHIREMADYGILLGSHGVNHTFLTRQNNNKARYEIEASKKTLEDGLGKPVCFFSYPYGNYDDRIINLVQEAGYDAAFSLRPELLKAELAYNNTMMYALPRIAIYLVDNMQAFKTKIGCSSSRSLPYMQTYMQKVKNRLINRCAYASVLVERLRR